MKIGFTGTRRGMSSYQKKVLTNLRNGLEPKRDWFHFGMCQGADTEAFEIMVGSSILTAGHPPINKKAFVDQVCDVLFEPKEYLDRNKDIVDQCDLLVACPLDETQPEQRSGTWATIRYAKFKGRPTLIIPRNPQGGLK